MRFLPTRPQGQGHHPRLMTPLAGYDLLQGGAIAVALGFLRAHHALRVVGVALLVAVIARVSRKLIHRVVAIGIRSFAHRLACEAAILVVAVLRCQSSVGGMRTLSKLHTGTLFRPLRSSSLRACRIRLYSFNYRVNHGVENCAGKSAGVAERPRHGSRQPTVRPERHVGIGVEFRTIGLQTESCFCEWSLL